ncbi:MAG TPA: amino acid deaminase/aldolase [Nocardioidaceae bacterium]|nr:amino acid deaminase/aldolase [Nocardioidaceae bacterium]
MSRPRTAGDVARHRLHARLDEAVARLDEQPATPTAVVDLDAFDANAADLVRRAAGTPIRVASKSLRVPALISRALAVPGFAGVLTYSLREALWLCRHGVCDDLVMGYPTVDRGALAELVNDEAAARAVVLMVDDLAQLEIVDDVRRAAEPPVRVALDVDAGLRLGPSHIGPKRSPLHDADEVLRLAREVVARPGFELVGVMTYEGQVAGVPDDVPWQAPKSLAVRRLKTASVRQLGARRRRIADGLRGLADLRFWNAGGSGSVETSAADPVVTEVSAGSGLLVPHLFDHYRSFQPRPAAFFGLRVVRRPAPGTVTVAGGGLIGSGPAGKDRSPLPWAPPGLHLIGLEGAGEVQTPLVGPAAGRLRIGDLVWFRHAKSGEFAEHVPAVHLLAGDRIVEAVPTYRGTGNSW